MIEIYTIIVYVYKNVNIKLTCGELFDAPIRRDFSLRLCAEIISASNSYEHIYQCTNFIVSGFGK